MAEKLTDGKPPSGAKVSSGSSGADIALPETKTVDLQVNTLARNIQRGREIAFAEGPDEIALEAELSLPGIVKKHSGSLGMSPEQFNQAAKEQGLDVERMIEEIGRKGRQSIDYFDELKAADTTAVKSIAERKVKARGEEIDKLGSQRIITGEARKVEGVDKLEDRLEALKDLRKAPKVQLSEKTSSIFGKDSLDEEEEVVQYGQQGSEHAWRMKRKLKADPELQNAVDLFNQSFVTTAGDDFIQWHVKDNLKRQNIQPNNPEYTSVARKAYKEAMEDLTGLYTAGLWTAPTFIQGWDTGREGGETTLSDAVQPTVEIIGFNAQGNIIARQESPMQWGLEMLDLPQSALAGMISGKGAVQGIAKRKLFLDNALQSDMARDSLPGKIAAGSAGAIATVVFPDVTILFGGAAAITKRFVTLAKNTRKVNAVAPELERSVELMVKGMNGDMAAAEEAARIHAKIRDDFPELGDALDTMEVDVVNRFTKLNPDLIDEKLSDMVPGDANRIAAALHTSKAKRTFRATGESGSPIFGRYSEFYNYNYALDKLDEALALVRNKDNRMFQVFVEKGTSVSRSSLRSFLTKSDIEPDASIVNLLNDFDEIAAKPQRWKKRVQSRLRTDLAGAPDSVKTTVDDLLDAVISQRNQAIQKAPSPAEMDAAIGRAKEAVYLNMEARANASELTRQALYGLIGKEPPPLNVIAGARPLRDVSEVVEFSPRGIKFMDDLMDTMGMTRAEAMATTRIAEGMANAAKRSYGTDPIDWYADTFENAIRGVDDFVAEFGPRQGAATQTAWQVAPLQNGSFHLTSQQIRDSTKSTSLLEGMTFTISPKTLRVKSIELPDELRGKGAGLETYMEGIAEAKRRGLSFYSDVDVSTDAARVYEKMIDAGIPLKRFKTTLPDGSKGAQYRLLSTDLAKTDLDVALSKGLLTDPGAVNPSTAAKFMDNGRMVLYGLGQANFKDVARELGRVAMKQLTPADQAKIVQWLDTTQGVKVTLDGGQFTGTPQAVRAAEEAFAETFSDYVTSGRLPSMDVKPAYEKIKDFFLEIYQAVTRSKTPLTLADEVEDIFADMVTKAPPREPIMKRTLKMLDEQLLGRGDRASVQSRGTQEIIRRLRRANIKTEDAEELTQKTAAANLAKDYDTPVITFDRPMFGKELGNDGVTELNLRQIAALSLKFDEQVKISKAANQSNLARVMRQQVVDGMTPAERIDAFFTGDVAMQKIGRTVKNTLIGGNAADELKGMNAEMRKRVLAAERTVANSTHEAIRLVTEAALDASDPKLMEKIYDYLSGKNVVFAMGGRRLLSSGNNTTRSVLNNMTYFVENGLTADQQRILREYVEAVADGNDLRKAAGRGQNVVVDGKEMSQLLALENIIKVFWKNDSSPFFLQDLIVAVRPEVASKGATPTPDIIADLTEMLMYYSGKSRRNGAELDPRLTDRQITEKLLDEVAQEFGPESRGRVSILIATHGSAELARRDLKAAGLGLDSELAGLWNKWLNGEYVPPSKMAALQRFADRIGMNTRVESAADTLDASKSAEILLDSPVHLPVNARARIAKAIARGTDPEQLRKAKGFGASESDLQGLHGVLLRALKIRMTRGAVGVRQRYFLMNTIDHFAQMAVTTGLAPAIASETRLAFQNFMAVPGVARSIDIAARNLDNPQMAEKFRDLLQEGGDATAQKISKWLNLSKYDINVNPILDGRDEIIQVGNSFYNAQDLRRVFVEEGVFSSFDVTQLKSAIEQLGAQMLRQADDLNVNSAKVQEWLTHAVTDMAEAWGERERIGAAVSLMEQGIDPRAAARLSVDALFDYGMSMSKGDRHWFVSMLFPFWAFQKNANRMVVNNLFSPMGAYRMSILRRAPEAIGELTTEILYDSISDPYGVDVSAMPPELQSQYYGLRSYVEEAYGGKPSDVPEEVRLQMRAWLQGHVSWVDGKKIKYVSDDVKEMLREAGMQDSSQFANYAVPTRDKATRAPWLRDRPGIAIPANISKANNNLIAKATNYTGEYPQLELFFPDSTFHAGYRHMANVLTMYVQGLELLTGAVPTDSDIELRQLRNVLVQTADPERAPILGDGLRATMGKEAMPVLVHPLVADLYENVFQGTELLRVPAISDPLGGPPNEEEQRLKSERIYILGGIASTIWRQTPGLAEMNQMLLKQMSPTGMGLLTDAEKLDGLRTAAGALRIVTGAQVEQSSRKRTARQSTPRQTVDAPALKRSR